MNKYRVEVIETKTVYLTYEIEATSEDDATNKILHDIVEPYQIEDGDGECIIDTVDLIIEE